MTPEIYHSVMHTIYLSMATIGLNLISSCFIILAALNIRKATRINREWTANLVAWSEALRDSDTRPKDGDAKQGSTRE
jgi:hypothetical protein